MPSRAPVLAAVVIVPALAFSQPQQTIQQAPINVYAAPQQQQQHQQHQQQQQQQQQWVQQQQQQTQQYQQQWRRHQAGQGPAPKVPDLPKALSAPERRPLRVEINGVRYGVTVDARNRLEAAIRDYRTTNNVGGAVLGFAAFLSLFDLYSVDADRPALDALLKLVFEGSDIADVTGTVTLLSAPNKWSQVTRDTFARMLLYEAHNAELRHEREERLMWLHLRDIILNYERYEDGGIRFDASNLKDGNPITPQRLRSVPTPKLMLRSMPGENFRGIASLTGPFKAMDQDQLARMRSVLSYFPQASDFLATADFVMDLDFTRGPLNAVNKRDAYLLNQALMSVPSAYKARLRQALRANARNPMLTEPLWAALLSFVDEERWNGFPGLALDSEEDRFGYWHDLPEARSVDLAFTGVMSPRPYYWVGPAPQGSYTFYWSGGASPAPTQGWTFHWPGSGP